MYYLPNNIPVDVEGIIEGMLDFDQSVLYYFDIKTGDVVSVQDGSTLPTDVARYLLIPKVHQTSREKWIKEFFRECSHFESRQLIDEVKKVFEHSGAEGVYIFLENRMNHFSKNYMSGTAIWHLPDSIHG